MSSPVTSQAATVQIARINVERLLVPIRGTSPLIVHKFSEKAKRQMLDAQQGRKTPKERRDPEADYQASFYRTESGYGFPAVAFKSATVGAARFYGKDVRMTDLRQSLFFRGKYTAADPQALVEIVGEPVMREDVVRLGISGTDRMRAFVPIRNTDSEPADYMPIHEAMADDFTAQLVLRQFQRELTRIKVQYGHLREYRALMTQAAQSAQPEGVTQ